MPDDTIAAFLDHGTVARTVDADPDGRPPRARRASAPPAWTWPTWPTPSRTKGVASFAKSFDELIQTLSDKANALSAGA